MRLLLRERSTSFISNKSISSSCRPADFNAAGIATAGPIPITAGSTPMAAKLLQEKFQIVTESSNYCVKIRLFSRDNSGICTIIMSSESSMHGNNVYKQLLKG